jgi:hypothetical protein
MGFRRFDDDQGHAWENRPRSRSEWHFEPLPGNPAGRRTVRPPTYEEDPFELTAQELQRLLGGASSGVTRTRPSPFKD